MMKLNDEIDVKFILGRATGSIILCDSGLMIYSSSNEAG